MGRVEWIGLRTERRGPISIVDYVDANPDFGLVGDRYSGRSGNRQVTLIQAEHLPVIAACAGRSEVHAELLRRNIVVSGINLLALKGAEFLVGEARMAFTGLCQPCSRMEELLGPGGYNAVRGHGGITARVLCAGSVSVGNSVRVAPAKPVTGGSAKRNPAGSA